MTEHLKVGDRVKVVYRNERFTGVVDFIADTGIDVKKPNNTIIPKLPREALEYLGERGKQ